MTQEDVTPDNDRSRPRYQPPAAGSFSSANSRPTGTTGSFSTTNSSPSGTNPGRPADWPAPDPAYPPPPPPDPTANVYGPPPPFVGPYGPPPPTWGGRPPMGGSGPDNYYRYERYSQTPYQPAPPADPQAEAYRKAAYRVRAKLDFRRHLQSYILVNALLWAIALITMNPFRPSFWPIWITVFWGIGLVAQYWKISGREDEQRQRMIDEEMRRKHHY